MKFILLLNCARILPTFAISGFLALHAPGATFSGAASLVATNDPSNSLTSTSGVFTVSCWFKLSIPSTLSLTENLTLFMDRADGNESLSFSYQARVNATSGNLEFATRGSSGGFTNTLLSGMFVGRWYHLAVVRNGTSFSAYVDGRQVMQTNTAVGTTTGDRLSIGGINGTSRLFYGDITEFALYRDQVQPDVIRVRMFEDQRNAANLAAYYKLGYSTNSADLLHNFVPSPPGGTDPLVKVGTGNIPFEEVDQAGEQSIFDSRLNAGRNAIVPLAGTFFWQQTALARPVPGILFDLRFGYSSAIPASPADGSQDDYGLRTLGTGWRHMFDARIMPGGNDKELRMLTWDGAIETWSRTNTAQPYQTQHGEYRGAITRLPNFEIEWTSPERLIYRFFDPTSTSSLMSGRLAEIRDPHGNKLTVQWNPTEYHVEKVFDSAGDQYNFNYGGGLLTNVTFGQWQVNFSYVSNQLASKWVTNTSGMYSNVNTTWRFYYNYSGHQNTFGLLNCLVDPEGRTNSLVQFDKYRRKTQITDALNQSVQIQYGVPDSRSTMITDADGFNSTNTFDRKGRLIFESDPLGNTTTHAYNPTGQRIRTSEPGGGTTSFDFDPRGNMTARTNALGEVTRWTFHPVFNKATSEVNPLSWTTLFTIDDVTGDVLSMSDGLGLIVTNLFSTNGLLLAATDARGNTVRSSYDTNGFLISQTDADSNTTLYAVNELGWRFFATNALGQVSTTAYDVNGNTVLVTDPLQRNFRQTFDGSGNALSKSDAKGRFTTYAYDPANQRTNLVDRTGTNIWRYTYTKRGKAERLINPLGVTTTNFYDAANRLVRVMGPLGQSITNHYDARGNLTNIIDQLGRSWRRAYDILNRVVSESDPYGNTKLTEYDAAGRVKRVTAPSGAITQNAYDGRGRLTLLTDPEGHHWHYAYDSSGNLTNITDALNGQYVLAYGRRNERILERNQDNKEWHYAYDELGRLEQQTDPNGITRTLDYDDAGRVLSVSFSTGRVNSFAYDDNDNPEVLSRSGSGPATLTQLRYDLLDRLTECKDAFNKTVRYDYDALNRRSKLVYPDGKTLSYGYDALNRLTNQVDWAGRQLTYAYDQASRLIRRTYPNGIVQTNSFDDAGRITGLSHSPIVVNTNALNLGFTYAYDRNGNKTNIIERGTLDWPEPALSDEAASYTPSGRLIDRHISINNQLSTINYAYDPSGNMTNAVGNGQSWALTYDEDNRTTSIKWEVLPTTTRNITNRYDALGRRISRMADTTETRFVLDFAGGMERTLCDVTSSGVITAWYVHGADLCYRVDATNGLTCFHADAQANIIALSGSGTNTLAQYAYTPYGRSLASSIQNPASGNQYTFVGSQGVMEELPGLYFTRARYYSGDCGIFFSTDPARHFGPVSVGGSYSYGMVNPLSYIDPNGEFPIVGAIAFGVSLGNFAQKAIHGELKARDFYVLGGSAVLLIADVATMGVVGGVVGVAATVGGGTLLGWELGELVHDYCARQASDVIPAETTKPQKQSASDEKVTAEDSQQTPVDESNATQSQKEPNITKDHLADLYTSMQRWNDMVSLNGGKTWIHAEDAARVLQARADRINGMYKDAASSLRFSGKLAATANRYWATYRQQRAMYSQLVSSYENSDYLDYLIQAQTPRQLADQAFAQYRRWNQMANEAMSDYSRLQNQANQASKELGK